MSESSSVGVGGDDNQIVSDDAAAVLREFGVVDKHLAMEVPALALRLAEEIARLRRATGCAWTRRTK